MGVLMEGSDLGFISFLSCPGFDNGVGGAQCFKGWYIMEDLAPDISFTCEVIISSLIS